VPQLGDIPLYSPSSKAIDQRHRVADRQNLEGERSQQRRDTRVALSDQDRQIGWLPGGQTGDHRRQQQVTVANDAIAKKRGIDFRIVEAGIVGEYGPEEFPLGPFHAGAPRYLRKWIPRLRPPGSSATPDLGHDHIKFGAYPTGHEPAVLTPNQIVPLASYELGRRPNGPGPLLGLREIEPFQFPFEAELQQGRRLLDGHLHHFDLAGLHQVGRVFAVRHHGDSQIEIEFHRDLEFIAADRRSRPGLVGIESQHHPFGKPAKEIEVFFPESRPTRGNCLCQAGYVQPNHIRVPLDHQ
jgi:hypothetical protein